MNLQNDARPGGNFLSHPVSVEIGPFPRSVRSQQDAEQIRTLVAGPASYQRTAVGRARAIVNHRRIKFYSRERSFFVEDTLVLFSLCFRSTAPFARSGKGLRRQHVSNRMMHDPPVARTNLCCLDPHVVSESSRNRVIDIAVRGIRFYGEILTHREHLIGFAYY